MGDTTCYINITDKKKHIITLKSWIYGAESGQLGTINKPQGRETRGTIQTPKMRKRKLARGKQMGTKKKKTRTIGWGIFNLSDVIFNEGVIKVLDLGLKYAPDKDLDTFEVYIDLQNVIRKLNINMFFASKKGDQHKPEKMGYKHSELRNNKIFNPKMQNNESLEVFKGMVEEDNKKLKAKKFRQANIWKTIKEIEKK